MIGKRIELLRRAHRKTQAGLAQELGISQSKLSRIENRGCRVDFELVQRLARMFNQPLDVFQTDDPTAPLITITVDRHSKVVQAAGIDMLSTPQP
jgi:transcriptional regulator with XRE-family HTH domain